MKIQVSSTNNGMVLITVVMIILVMTLLLTAIISQNLSKVSMTQSQIDEIKAKQLAKGVFWKAQADMTYSGGQPTVPSDENLDGKRFSITIDQRPTTAPYQYNVTIDY